MIILEFELERDMRNPLYPITSTGPSNASSPSNNFANSATSTLSTTGLNTNVVVSSDPSSTKAENRNTDSSQKESSLLTAPILSAEPENGDHWVPSAEDILESTTRGRSKPIPALERLRSGLVGLILMFLQQIR